MNTAVADFLSTLSLRRATMDVQIIAILDVVFYPRSPCGERQFHRYPPLPCYQFFYPRSPCGERPSSSTSGCRLSVFLSTLSLRRATRAYYMGAGRRRSLFYPRSPCGERRCISRSTPVQAAFLSTLSLRRATARHLMT